MLIEVSYSAFKWIAEKWKPPFIYFYHIDDVEMLTVNTIPTMKTIFAIDSPDHTDFVLNLKPIADILELYDPITRIPKIKVV